MADESAQTGPNDNPEAKDAAAFVQYWLDQLGAYEEEFKDWRTRAKKIIARYRDDRSQTQDGANLQVSRFNALWSNVQTLLPAVYIKPPKAVAERRFLDKDPLARLASQTLERSLDVQIEVGYFHPTMQKCVLDYLLVGRGTMWERYEPTYGEAVDIGDNGGAQYGATPAQAQEQPGEAPRPVTYEKVCTDYVGWDNFRHSPAPIWDDVWWVAKKEMLTRKELRARFKEKDPASGKPIADLIPLQRGDKDNQNDNRNERDVKRKQPRAIIWEIWNKVDREVIFIAPDWPNAALERSPDPLGLQSFWPCPKPLYATTTNETLVPIPDYVEYQDQADELDSLTARIKALTDAVRVNGVYDASYPELKRILQEGVDNRMIGVKNYAEFAAKGGLEAAMDFVPLQDVVEALVKLYEARERTKADMAEITGLSDIVRGQAQGTTKTATEQKIKGQFASLRLEDRKKEVSRFARDGINIAGEIIAEQFSCENLAAMTGMIPFIADEIRTEAPPQQPPMMGHNGGPPLDPTSPGMPSPGVGAPGQPALPAGAGMQPPPVDFNALAQQRFKEVCSLLKDDKMRTFRIDIETDSTIEVDKQAAKDSVVELFTAVGGFLEKALPIGQVMPQLTPALGQSILFAFRRFGAGRDVESVWEQAIDQLTQMAKNPGPKPPSPEEIKAQAEQQKQQAETERMQMQAQIDQQKAEMDMEVQRQKAQIELEKAQAQLQIDQQKLALEREKMAMEQQKAAMGLQVEQQKAQIQGEAAERDAAMDERAAQRKEQSAIRQDEMAQRADERDAKAGERDFKLQEKVANAKAKQAMKPKEPA